jgi:hypothetical protein
VLAVRPDGSRTLEAKTGPLVSGRESWTGGDATTTQVLALSEAERQVLAVLAVIGRASLSSEELAALVEVEDITPVIGELERRGLIKSDEKRRYSALGRIGEEIRRTDEALSSADRLLSYMTTLAQSGRLTPDRLAADAAAILGLSEWAAETGQWERLLELVKTLQACFGIAQRVQEWLALLDLGRRAAQALGDKQSEVWVLQQLATASASAGDAASAQQYLGEADELQRQTQSFGRAPSRADEPVKAAREALTIGGAGGRRLGLWIIGLIIAAGAGAGAGYAIGNGGGGTGGTTAPVSVTVTLPRGTITTSGTVTLPATTVLTTTTELTTTTVTTTVTTGPG